MGGSGAVFQAVRGEVCIKRDAHGVPHVQAGPLDDLLFGLGWVAAADRGVQLELTRLVARGRTAECLKADDKMVALDRAMRRYDLWGDAKFQAECLGERTRELVAAYCLGIDRGFAKSSLPLEFRLIRHRPEQWTPADCIAVLKLTGLVDMTETQGWAEKLIVQMIRRGVDLERLKELFPYMVEDLDPGYLELMGRIELEEPMVPETLAWSRLPRTYGSNNWAVAGSRTASGKALLAGDPHLDVSRLPAIWQEVALEGDSFYFTGAAVPGIPFPALGRTAHLAWSPTYAFMDVSDYFVELVKGGRYRRGGEWREFDVRDEVVRRKGGEPVVFRYYQTDLGVLEGDPSRDGYFLCFAWSAARDCGAESLEAMAEIMLCESVKEALPLFSRLDFAAFNWVAADTGGNIGYQMSGRSPLRAEGCSGLLPLPGWDPAYHWRGYLPREDLPSLYNPPEGFIVTANQDLNRYGKGPVINLCMAPYRAERIAGLLAGRERHDAAFQRAVQYDLYSRQAEVFMEKLRPLLPDTPNGRLLEQWDLRYDLDSLGATLFERVYLELVKLVFGERGMGREVMDHLLEETIIFTDFFGNFDEVLLREDALWFDGRSQEELMRLALERSLQEPPVPYGSWRRVLLKNIFFEGRLPRWTGFDRGPLRLPGGRATVSQGQIFRSAGRLATYAPAIRFTADFAEEGIRSVLAGGPSGRRFSRWYASGLKDWSAGTYKHLAPGEAKGSAVAEESPKS
jgi:penicillin amidase